MVYTDCIEGIDKNDYVLVDGKIEGTLVGTNAFGGKIENTLIVDAKVTKCSYMDVVTPTIAEILPAASQDQNGMIVTADKLEYAEDETCVYVTIKNDTEYNFTCSSYSSKLVMDGQQIDRNKDSMTLYKTLELNELSYEVMAKTSASGTIIFPAIEKNESFQFVLPNSRCSNYDLKFKN